MEQLITGALDADSEEAQAAFERSPGLRESWLRMSSLCDDMDAIAHEEREILDEAANTPSEMSIDQIEALVLEHASPRRRPRAPGWLLAAGVLLGVGLGGWIFSGDKDMTEQRSSGVPDVVLSGSDPSPMTIFEPEPTAEEALIFRYVDEEAGFSTTYIMKIYALDVDVLGREVCSAEDFLGTGIITFDPEKAKEIPKHAVAILYADTGMPPAPPPATLHFQNPLME